MKIALCTSDFFSPIQDVIATTNHVVEHVYTSCDLNTGFSNRTKDFAQEMRSKFTVGRVTEADIQSLDDAGVELLIAAAYDYKVPTPADSKVKFINVHGSLLPEGRGCWPQPWLLLKHPEHAGVTFHSMTQKWDTGDIVLQQKIDLRADDNFDSLIAKTLVAVKQLAEQLFRNFEKLWSERKPMQGEGSYWNKPQDSERTINVSQTKVSEANSLRRAFGDFTLLHDSQAGETHQLTKFSAWNSSHDHTPGEIIAISPPFIIYALKDGFASASFQS